VKFVPRVLLHVLSRVIILSVYLAAQITIARALGQQTFGTALIAVS
jgi:hypothetical protein